MDNLPSLTNFLTSKPSRYTVQQQYHASFKVAMKALLHSNACKPKLCIQRVYSRSAVDAN